jgi:hypothetical protein
VDILRSKSGLSKLFTVGALIIVIIVVAGGAIILYPDLFDSPPSLTPQSTNIETLSPSPAVTSSSTTSSQPITPNPTEPITPSPTPTPIQSMSLSDAISSGVVQATFSGDGNCAGDCINLKIKRLVTYTLEITPPSMGTQLTTSGSSQNMVLYKLEGEVLAGDTYWPTSTIELSSSDEVTYVFSAYCLNFHKSNPESSTHFTLSGLANSNVVKVLNAASTLSSSTASLDAIQTAIWVVTDNVSESELSSTFPVSVNEISNAELILTTAGIDTSGKLLFT